MTDKHAAKFWIQAKNGFSYSIHFDKEGNFLYAKRHSNMDLRDLE